MTAALRLPERDLMYEAKAKQILKETHCPEDLEGVVKSKPPPGAIPIKIFSINMKRVKRKNKDMAPCPICSPNSPQYLKGGFTWWQDEGVYRCVGDDCIASLCGEENAAKVLRDHDYKEARDKEYEFAVYNIGIAPAVRDYLTALLVPTEHAEYLRLLLAKAKVRGVLWQLAKQNDGNLIAWETREVQQLNPRTNEIENRKVRMPINYGGLNGHAALKPEFKLRTKLTTVTNNIGHFCMADAEDQVLEAYGQTILRSFQKAMNDAQKIRKTAREEIEGVLAFFNEANFDRINRYGHDMRTTENLFAQLKNGAFKIGPDITEAISIRPNFAVMDGLPVWPLAE